MTTDRLSGARFSKGPSPAMADLSRSPRGHSRLAPENLRASAAHARELNKNADSAELTRGRASRLIAALNGTPAMLKRLPFAYNRDPSEDERAAFEALDGLALVPPAMAGMIRTMSVDAERLRADAAAGFTLATEAADWPARRGVPFSEAHGVMRGLVRHCEARGIDIPDLAPENLAAVDARLTPDAPACSTLDAALAARSGYNGTAPHRVAEQLGRLKAVLREQRGWACEAP